MAAGTKDSGHFLHVVVDALWQKRRRIAPAGSEGWRDECAVLLLPSSHRHRRRRRRRRCQ